MVFLWDIAQYNRQLFIANISYFLYNTYRSEGNYELDIIRDEPIAFALYEYNVLEAAFSSIQGAGYDYDSDTIYSIEVVSNGQTIASLGENDLVINRGAYDVKDNSISELLIDYFSPLSSCSIYAPKTQD